MANEEKAKEIAIENSREWIDQDYGKISTEGDCYNSAIAMAMYKDAQLAKYCKKLTELITEKNFFKDKKFISADFLLKHGFEKRKYDFLYCDDCIEISAQCTDNEAGIWRVCITFLDFGHTQILDICTLGQLRMFLTICGLEDFSKQLR